jgi:hypothetical protein
MSFIQNFFTSRDNNANTETYVGQTDRLWYNPDNNTIRVSDGSTPGGLPVDFSSNANVSINNLTANTGNIIGNLVVGGNISPAANGKIGGVQPGPGVVIGTNGMLTIDSANLPVSFGNFYANNNILSIVNLDQNMILETQGNAEIQLVGNIGFYKTDGVSPAGQYFAATNDGQIEIIAATIDNLNGAVKITGNEDGITQTPVVGGVMLQLTGQPNVGSRLYSDSNNDRTLFVGRRYNGTAAAPTPVLAGEEVLRIAATGYPGNAWPSTGLAQIRFLAEENQTSTARGGRIEFTAVPLGQLNVATIMTINDANGVNATKFTTSGTVSATGNINGANLTGNHYGNGSALSSLTGANVSGQVANAIVAGTVYTAAQPNITSTGTLVSLSISGNANIGNIGTGGLITATGNISGANINGFIHATAGTTSSAPITVSSGTNLTSASAGTIEYDGTAFYATPTGTQRGVVRAAQTFVLQDALSFTPGSGAQTSMFGVGATVSSNTRYLVKITATVSKNGGGGQTLNFGIGGTATLGNISYQAAVGINGSVIDGTYIALSTGFATGNTIYSTNINAGQVALIQINGVLDVASGGSGTIIPTLGWSATPGTVTVGKQSTIELYPIGVQGANTNVGTWA